MEGHALETPSTLYDSRTPLVSLVSYRERCNAWGDGRYRGNCDGRLFLQLVQHYQPRSVADPMLGSGTTRDVIAGLNREKNAGIRYWGGDLRLGFNLLTDDLPGSFDLVWIHPPYWSIIKYSDHPDDLSNASEYPDYQRKLRICLRRCSAALNPGGRLAILVGDVRRNGKYTPLGRDLLNLEGELGQLRSIIIKAQHQCRSDRIEYARLEDPRILHEYCVVFKRREEAELARDER